MCLSSLFYFLIPLNQQNLVLNQQFLCTKIGPWIFQAYTNELELEIAHLQTENARLKIQQEQVKLTLTSCFNALV